MAKIVKNKKTGLLGAVLIELPTGVSVVFEDGEWVNGCPGEELELVGEGKEITSPSQITEESQNKIVASALETISRFRTKS